MEHCFQHQLQRLDRLLSIIEADDQTQVTGELRFYDYVIFACLCTWHLKDWVLRDPEFGARDRKHLSDEIHAARCLLVCADLANGSKHLTLHSPKTGASIGDRTGVNIDSARRVFKTLYFVTCEARRPPRYCVAPPPRFPACRLRRAGRRQPRGTLALR